MKEINKKTLVSLAVICLCLVLYKIFPSEGIFQKIIKGVSFFLLVPYLYIKIILKKKLSAFGVQEGDWKRGLYWSGIAFVFTFLSFYVLYQFADFSNNYSLTQAVTENFVYFVFYELFLVGLFVVMYEFFFRGFVMGVFFEKMRVNAVFIQFIIFILFLMFANSLDWSNVPYVVTALFAGIVAYKSRSLIYSIALSWISIIISDVVFIKLIS